MYASLKRNVLRCLLKQSTEDETRENQVEASSTEKSQLSQKPDRPMSSRKYTALQGDPHIRSQRIATFLFTC